MTEKAIGGYFDIEIGDRIGHYHSQAIKLNTARNALEYILRVKVIKKLYLPYFTCEALLEPLHKLKIPFEFYLIDEKLEPIFEFSILRREDAFLYTNYYGLKNTYIKQLSVVCKQLIVDNAQAFYSEPYNNPTIYSARKFFGVADGAYLYCEEKLDQFLDKDFSHNRMSHLLIRKDISAEAGYADFIANDKSLDNKPIMAMSSLTDAILKTIDYDAIAKKRIENYRLLDSALKGRNQLSIVLEAGNVPMVYPYWTKDLTLRERLQEHKIYTATYWPNVKTWCKEKSLEYRLTNEVVYLPIDQRYDLEDMKKILMYV